MWNGESDIAAAPRAAMEHHWSIPDDLLKAENKKMRVRFGDFALDTGTRELTRSGTVQALSSKAFDLLAILVADRPRIVSLRPDSRSNCGLTGSSWRRTSQTSYARFVRHSGRTRQTRASSGPPIDSAMPFGPQATRRSWATQSRLRTLVDVV